MEFVCVLLICEYQCHLWENILRWTVLRVPRVLWAFFSPTAFTLSFTSHSLHSKFYIPQISRIYRWFGCDMVPTEFTEFTEFGCDVVPTEFTEFTEFVCVLLICEYQCHLWENILRWTVLRVPRVLWAFFSPTAFTLSFTSHSLHSEFYIPQISL